MTQDALRHCVQAVLQAVEKYHEHKAGYAAAEPPCDGAEVNYRALHEKRSRHSEGMYRACVDAAANGLRLYDRAVAAGLDPMAIQALIHAGEDIEATRRACQFVLTESCAQNVSIGVATIEAQGEGAVPVGEPKAYDKIAEEVLVGMKLLGRASTITEIAAKAGRDSKTVKIRLSAMCRAGRVLGGETDGDWRLP